MTESSQWRVRPNSDLEILYQEVSICTFTKLQSLRWTGNLQRMDDVRNTIRIYQAKFLLQKRPKGRSKARRRNDMENDIRKNEIVQWRQEAREINEWRKSTGEAIILL